MSYVFVSYVKRHLVHQRRLWVSKVNVSFGLSTQIQKQTRNHWHMMNNSKLCRLISSKKKGRELNETIVTSTINNIVQRQKHTKEYFTCSGSIVFILFLFWFVVSLLKFPCSNYLLAVYCCSSCVIVSHFLGKLVTVCNCRNVSC